MSKVRTAEVDEHACRATSRNRIQALFPINKGLRPIAMLMANAHERAIDYIEQAPVIVLAATHGKHPFTRSECSFIQEQLAHLCQNRAKLRDVMHAYSLPLPLRLLDARVLISTRATVIRRLALMNPSTLAQIIPTTRQKQNAWLQALHTWCERMAYHSKGTPFFEWAATTYPGITYGRSREAGHMADFVSAHPDTFNPLWTRERARAEEQNWHAELGRDTRIACARGVALDTTIDYTPLPIRWEHEGYSFVALQTGRALHSEGQAMHHCVKTYWGNVISGQSRIYSVLQSGNRVATLELSCRPAQTPEKSNRYQLRQLAGPCNAHPTPDVSKVVRTFVEEINGGSAEF